MVWPWFDKNQLISVISERLSFKGSPVLGTVKKSRNLLRRRGRSPKDYIRLQGGRGGIHQKITLDYKGGGGRSRESKKRLHNFEESLNSMIFFGETIPPNSVLNLAELFHRIAFLFFSIPHPLFLCQVSQRRDSITET